MAQQTHTCGYRVVQGRAAVDSPLRGSGPDLDTYRDDDTCSYCGSLNPAILMERIERGDVELGPTDKSYKVYVRNVGGSPFKMTYRKCPEGAKCTGPDDCTHWVTEERGETKFYFYHFNDEQKTRFVELYNQQKMKLGYPHYFYNLPFFCVHVPKGE